MSLSLSRLMIMSLNVRCCNHCKLYERAAFKFEFEHAILLDSNKLYHSTISRIANPTSTFLYGDSLKCEPNQLERINRRSARSGLLGSHRCFQRTPHLLCGSRISNANWDQFVETVPIAFKAGE